MNVLADQRIDVLYHDGDVTPIQQPHTTGWRTLPFLINAYVSGVGRVEVAGHGTIRCRTGHALCVPAGIMHRGTLESPRGISRWSHVSFLVFGGLDLFSLLICPPIFYGPAARRLGEINIELAKLNKINNKSLTQTVEKQALCLSLLATIASVSHWRPDSDRLVIESKRIAPVIKSIREHLDGPISVENLAQMAHLSVPRFHAVFRQTTGMAPYAFVQNQRMARAQELLLSTDLSVNEIAAAVGQSDPFLFSRTFKKRYRMSPSEYRRTIKQSMTI